jgi:dATP/dGTP diphosphohydrolase
MTETCRACGIDLRNKPRWAAVSGGLSCPSCHDGNPATKTPAPTSRSIGLPTDAKERKTYPLATGCLDYFPDALAEVAHVSFVGNEQHNPGQPLHWDRSKSTDEADALMRHFKDRGTRDNDNIRHSAKVAWRALALLQKEIENESK